MKDSLILILFLSFGLLLTACEPNDDDQQPAVVLFEEGATLADTDTLLVARAIAHRPTGASDTTFFSYNSDHQLTAVESPSADYSLEYDSEGRLSAMSWPENEITYVWQGTRLIKTAWQLEGVPTQYYLYRYDHNLRLMLIERHTNAEMEEVKGNFSAMYQEEEPVLPAGPQPGEIILIGLASYESGEHEFQGAWSYTEYDDSPSLQGLLDLMPAPDEEMQQGFSMLYPGRLFRRNIAAYRWQPAGHSNNPYIRMEYSHNSAGYAASVAKSGSTARVEFVYQVVKKE